MLVALTVLVCRGGVVSGVVAVAGAVTTDDMVQVRALQPGAATSLSKDAPDGYFAVWSGVSDD